MKKNLRWYFIAFMLMLTTGVISAQNTSEKKEEQVYNFALVESAPQFHGGTKAMYEWLANNIHYPEKAAEVNVYGKVLVGFIITKTGEVSDVRILRGRHPALDAEAIRVVKAMPRWYPALHKGEAVNCYYPLTVTFKPTN